MASVPTEASGDNRGGGSDGSGPFGAGHCGWHLRPAKGLRRLSFWPLGFGMAVPLTRTKGERAASFTFELLEAGGFTRAVAATGSRVALVPVRDGRLKVSLPMNVCDAVVLLR